MYYHSVDKSITKQLADMVHYFFVNPFMSHLLYAMQNASSTTNTGPKARTETRTKGP